MKKSMLDDKRSKVAHYDKAPSPEKAIEAVAPANHEEEKKNIPKVGIYTKKPETAKTVDEKALKDKIRESFMKHMDGHKDLEHDLAHFAADEEKGLLNKSIVDEMFEILAKGSFQKKVPFNPQAPENQNITSKQRRWTHDEDSDVRDNLPKMEGNARIRALNKLAKDTHVRKHPETGERLFLMHRGMGQEEFTGAHKNGKTAYGPGEKTSWTPHKHIADDFGSYNDGVLHNDKSRVVSAWVPESAISHSINQFNAPHAQDVKDIKTLYPEKGEQQKKKVLGQRSNTEVGENEWIIEHNQPFHHANMKALQSNIDNKISAKAGAEDDKASFKAKTIKPVGKYGMGFKGEKKDLAASETDKVITEDKLPEVKKPFKSKKQRRFAYANPEKFGGKEGVQEWESKTPKDIPESLEKFEIPKPIKATVLTAALASAGHQMTSQNEPQQQVRQPAAIERQVTPKDQVYNQAYHEGMKTSYVNSFQKKPSHVIVKEMIKKHPDLSQSHGYMLKLGPNAFKEVVKHNEPLVKEIGSRYYDHLNNTFQGDHDKIERAFNSNIKGAKEYKPEPK
jgi:hypothetical protein